MYSKKITIYGGNKENDKVFLCNWKVIYNIRDKYLHWKLFIKNYNKELNSDVFYDEIRYILSLSDSVKNDELYLYINKLLSSKESFLLKKLKKDFYSYECLSMAVKEFFFLLVSLFESMVRKFLSTRNDYISNHGLADHKFDVYDLIKDCGNKNTSSPLLYQINNLDLSLHSENKELNNCISHLKSELNSFQYPGFCQYMPIKRLQELLMFPLDELEKCTSMLSNSYEKYNFYLLNKHIKEHSKEFENHISKLEKIYRSSDKIHKIQLLKKNDSIQIMKTKMNELLNIYLTLYDRLKSIETIYDDLADLISKMNQIFRDHLNKDTE